MAGPRNDDVLPHVLGESESCVHAVSLEVDHPQAQRVEPEEERVGVHHEPAQSKLNDCKPLRRHAVYHGLFFRLRNGDFVEVFPEANVTAQLAASFRATGCRCVSLLYSF